MIRLFTLALITCCLSLEAAAPVTHAYFAHLWSEAYHITDPLEKETFIAGNLFPDIRYLGTISRKKTHEKNVTRKKIQKAENLFRAGMRLHAFVDVKREEYIERFRVMSHLKEIPKHYRVQFLKLLEDEILFSKLNWSQTQTAMLSTYDEQEKVGVTEETTNEWHSTMIAYFDQPPYALLQNLAAQQQGFLKVDPKTVVLWTQLLPLYAQDPYFITYVDEMISHLKSRF